MLDRDPQSRFARARKKGRHLWRTNLNRKSQRSRKRRAKRIGSYDGERSDVAADADIGLTDARAGRHRIGIGQFPDAFA